MTVEKLIKSIVAELPQIPFVTEQVGAAIDLAKKELDEEQLEKTLRITLEVTNYARQTSSDNFFKFHLVVISLLRNIPNIQKNKRFSMFETVSNLVGNKLSLLEETETEIERGKYKGEILKLIRLFNADQDLFLLEIITLIDELKPLTLKEELSVEELLDIVGYAYVENNLRMSQLALLNDVSKHYNKLIKIFEKTSF
jgi:hypothetical protein